MFIPALFAAMGTAGAGAGAAAVAGSSFVGASSTALSVLSTGLSVLGSLASASQQQDMANYNAKILSQNATIERQQAMARESAQRREANQILGMQRAGFAQAGAGLDGSAADVMLQSATNAELDSMMIRYEGDLRARGLKEQARQERFSGKTAMTQGYFNAAGSILGGVGDYMRGREDARYRSTMLGRMA